MTSRLRSHLPGLRRRHRSRGQSFVEFALILPVLLVLLAGAVDLGRVFYTNISVANAARAGALQAARTPASYLTGTDCPVAPNGSAAALAAIQVARQTNLITCAVQDEAHSVITVPASAITYACLDATDTTVACPSSPQTGIRSKVGVSTTVQLLTPLLRMIFPSGILTVSTAATADELALPTPVLPAGPTPTPTPTTEPTASPTPTPTPAQCTVPNLNGLSKSTAANTWVAFGFVRQNFYTLGANNGFVVPGSQTLAAGTNVACSASITVTLQ